MKNIFQFRGAGSATTLASSEKRFPITAGVQSWLFALVIGIPAVLFELVFGTSFLSPAQRFTLVLLYGFGLIYCAVQGLVYLEGKWNLRAYVSLGLGLSIALAYTCAASASKTGLPDLCFITLSRNVVVPVLCGIFAFHLWRKQNSEGYPTQTLVLLAVLSLASVQAPLRVAMSSVRMSPFWLAPLANATPIVSASFELLGLWGLVWAMGFLAMDASRTIEAGLRVQAERFGQLVESAACGICETDAHGRVVFANNAAKEILAPDGQSLTGLPIHDIFHAEGGEDARALSNFVLRPTAPVAHARAQVRRAQQDVVTLEWSSFPVYSNGKMTGAILTITNVTQGEANARFLNLRSEMLEMVARNRPVEDACQLLAASLEERMHGFRCSILACEGNCFRVAAAPSIPEAFRSAIDGLPCSNRLAMLSDRRSGPADWQETFRAVAGAHGFGGIWIEPVVSSANELLGVILLSGSMSTPLSELQAASLSDAARLSALTIERHRSFERLLHQGYHDSLTGLPNRLLLADRLKQGLARAARMGKMLALLCIDLDRFKHVNDTLGHDVGDLFLQQISVRLASRIRATDTLARTGGDEFTAIITDITNTADAQKVGESLLASLAEPFHVGGHTLYGGASIGISLYPQDGMDADWLHRNADRAMYRAKARGRNSVELYSSEEKAAERSDTIEIELHLHRAIEEGGFTLHYQPQFTCDHRLSGFEALLRFRHPKLGPIPPTSFVPIAEDSGLILPIGQWVLHEACRQIKEWQKKGMRPVRVAVNVSPLQFARSDFSETVVRALQTSDVKPELLELELTEGVLMSSMHDSKRQLESLAQIGVRLAVDDFGTGYSSLSYLHQLPIQVLKIDRSFISNMLEPAGTRSIVEAIVSLAQKLGLETVAEGVEEPDQLSLLQKAGCDLIQGYLFSRPLAAEDASSLLWRATIGGPTMRAPEFPVDCDWQPSTTAQR